MNPPLTEYLWNETTELRAQLFNTNFINGIRNGNLSPTLYGIYYLQDIAYLVESAKLTRILFEKTPDGNLKDYFGRLKNKYDSFVEHIMNK